jgi:hypothetical protein
MSFVEDLLSLSGRGLDAWERLVLEADKASGSTPWPMVPITIEENGHRLTFYVASDVYAVGPTNLAIRMPLSFPTAQAILDRNNALLPTRKMADHIWRAADVKLTPTPRQNRGANLADYLNHNAQIQVSLKAIGVPPGALTAGHKKDLVISNAAPGKLVIYGWHKPDGTPIQPLSAAHADPSARYVDYSHGLRPVYKRAELDGQDVDLEAIYKDPELSKLVSDEGPLKMTRMGEPGRGAETAGTKMPWLLTLPIVGAVLGMAWFWRKK